MKRFLSLLFLVVACNAEAQTISIPSMPVTNTFNGQEKLMLYPQSGTRYWSGILSNLFKGSLSSSDFDATVWPVKSSRAVTTLSAAGTVNVDFDVKYQVLTLNQNTTFTFSNASGSNYKVVSLWLNSDGVFTTTWPAALKSTNWLSRVAMTTPTAGWTIVQLEWNTSEILASASPDPYGVVSLNGLTGSTQTFATGTSGSDFGISSSGTTHTFNLPTASGSVRGALSSADWTTFNGKITATSTDTFQNKTLDSQATGNVLKFLDYKDFVYPARVDSVGATILTNDYSSSVWGLTTHAGTGGTNANYAIYRLGTVPLDLDTTVTMTLKNLAFLVSGTDANSASFSIGYFSPASSGAAAATGFTSLSGYVTFTSGSLTSPAAGDIFYMADVTLTGWASGLTAGRPFIIGIARDGTDANNDSITIVSGTIQYGRTQ